MRLFHCGGLSACYRHEAGPLGMGDIIPVPFLSGPGLRGGDGQTQKKPLTHFACFAKGRAALLGSPRRWENIGCQAPLPDGVTTIPETLAGAQGRLSRNALHRGTIAPNTPRPV